MSPQPSPSFPVSLPQLRAAAAALGPSEGRVAQVLLERPADVIDWSTQEVADAAGTSTATVVRACQTLGFRGFQHLRLELARLGGSPEQRTVAPGVPDALTRAFDEAATALTLSRDQIDRARVAEAVELLAEAGRVLFTGSGFSAPPLQDAALRFATIGRPVEAPADILAQQFAAHSLRPGDTCVALSYSGANAHTLATVRAAASRGAAVLAITGFSRSPLTRIADISLLSGGAPPAHGVDPFLSRLSQFVLLHTLHQQLGERLGAGDPAEMRTVVAEALTETHG